jgi:hypothetical protein
VKIFSLRASPLLTIDQEQTQRISAKELTDQDVTYLHVSIRRKLRRMAAARGTHGTDDPASRTTKVIMRSKTSMGLSPGLTIGASNLFDEGIGYRIVEWMNAGAVQLRTLEGAAGHRSRADELSNPIGMLMQPKTFAWDSFCLPIRSHGGCSDFFLHVSHQSVVSVAMRAKEFQDRVTEQLEELQLNPKSASDARVKRFCHEEH